MFGSNHRNTNEDALGAEAALMAVGVVYWVLGLASLLGHWFMLSALLCLLGSLALVAAVVVKQVYRTCDVKEPRTADLTV